MPAFPSSNSSGHRGLAERTDFALSRLQEESDIDFKQSATWEALQVTIVKTCLGMANLSRGGIIVIGVVQGPDAWAVKGVADVDMATFDPDEILDKVNAYASPSVRLTIVRHSVAGFTDLLVIEVQPFDTTPVICKKDGPPGSNLRAGTVYIRPRGKAETRAVRTADEMHDMLNRAAEIRSSEFLGTAERLGLRPSHTDRERFDKELGSL